MDFRLLDLIADLIVACEPPSKHGPGHPRSAIVRVVGTLRRFLREGLPWRSLRGVVAEISPLGATTPTHLTSFDADGDRASQLRHAVQHMYGDGNFGGTTHIRAKCRPSPIICL